MKNIKKYIIPTVFISLCLILIGAAIFCAFKYIPVAALCDKIAAGEEIDTKLANATSAPVWTDNFTKTSGVRIPLVEACRYRNLQAVRVLLANGADPDFFIDGRLSPLEAATVGTFDETAFEIVKLLIEHGADPNAYASSGPISCELAKHFAQGANDDADTLRFEAIIYLLEHGGATRSDETSVLHSILRGGYCGYAEELLSRGFAEVDERDSMTKTALIAVAQYTKDEAKAIECAELLLSRGADVRATDDDGMTAYDYAAERGYYRLAELLMLLK
ncbi:MAG: ankyrin repeat domain-containing protein [Eubacteriales bacterium]